MACKDAPAPGTFLVTGLITTGPSQPSTVPVVPTLKSASRDITLRYIELLPLGRAQDGRTGAPEGRGLARLRAEETPAGTAWLAVHRLVRVAVPDARQARSRRRG